MVSILNKNLCKIECEKIFIVNSSSDVPFDILNGLLFNVRDNCSEIVDLNADNVENLSMIIKNGFVYFVYEDQNGIHRTSDIPVNDAAKELCADFDKDFDSWGKWSMNGLENDEFLRIQKGNIRKLIDEVNSYVGGLKYLTTYENGMADCAFQCPDVDKDCVSCHYFSLILDKLAYYEHGDVNDE